jgi:DNA primase
MAPEEETSQVSAPPSGEKALSVLNKATNFRKKLTTTKRKLPSLDDEQKDKIRTELIHEFTNILKLYKNKTTRKKYIRRLNGLRTVFNQSLNKLNGTTRQRKRKTRVKKAKSISEGEMPEMPSSQYEEESSQMPPESTEM